MIGILFTTSEAATRFANKYANGRFDPVENDSPVRVGPLLVAMSGRGKIQAALATDRLLQTYDLEKLIHTGPCWSVTDEIEADALIGVSSVLEGDRIDLESRIYPKLPLTVPFDTPTEGVLVSQDHPSDASEDDSGYWERLADVRDNTGYAVAYVAGQHGTTCHVVKAVVDPHDASVPRKTQQQLFSFVRQVTDHHWGEEEGTS